MSETIINDIDLSKYFKNHYDSWGRLYCIEYKGNPLELQNDIKRLQEENKRLQMLSCANCGEKYLSPDGAELYEKNVQLQKENKQMQERLNNCEKFFNELGELLNEEVGNAYWTQAILHKIKKLIKINNELAEEHKTIGQDLYAEIKNYRKEKENLKEENKELKKRCEEWAWDSVKLQAQIDSKDYQLNKYKEILKDIRDIIEMPKYTCKEFLYISGKINEVLCDDERGNN